jgi:imidazolonepropionase-like amidohydrolase
MGRNLRLERRSSIQVDQRRVFPSGCYEEKFMRSLWSGCITCWFLGMACALTGTIAVARDVLIEHVTVVSAERPAPLQDATVTIHDSRITRLDTGTAAAPAPGTEVIDGRGLFLAPGLIDSHVHLGQIPGMSDEQERAHPQIARDTRAQIPRSYLYFGYTTLVDLSSTPEAMRIWQKETLRPDTYFCGGAPVMDGYPMQIAPAPARYRFMPYFLIEPGMKPPPGIDPAEHTPAAVVKRMKSDGAVCLKTYFEHGFGADHDLPVPTLKAIRTLIREAHLAGLPVLMHANATEAQRFALDAGVDIIAHGLWNWDESRGPGSDELTPAVRELLDAIAARQTGWQPTTRVMSGLHSLFQPTFLADPRLARVLPAGLIEWYRTPEGQWFRAEVEQEMGFPASMPPDARASRALTIFAGGMTRNQRAIGYLSAHGARILFGTDTPSAPTYANPPGLNGWLEMHALVEAGMTAAQVFRAATTLNAQTLRLPDVGKVAVGQRANLLLLSQDPTQTIEAYDHITKIILEGQVIDRQGLAAGRQ